MEKKILSNVVPLSSLRAGCYNTALLCAVFRFKRDFRYFMLWDAAAVDFRDMRFKMKLVNVFELDELMDAVGLQIQAVPAESESFIDVVCHCLDEDFPVLTYLDVFAYSNFLATYQKVHSEHCIMLFGYEKAKQIFHIVDHDYIEDAVYRRKTASFVDIQESFVAYLTRYHPRTYVEVVEEVRQDGFADLRDTVQEYLSFVTDPPFVENNQKAFAESSDFLNQICKSEKDFLAYSDQFYITTNSLFQKRLYEYQAFAHLFGEKNLAANVLEPLIDRYNFVRSIMYKTKIAHVYRSVSSEKSAAAFSEICQFEKQYKEVLDLMKVHLDEVEEFDYEKEVSLNRSFEVV